MPSVLPFEAYAIAVLKTCAQTVAWRVTLAKLPGFISTAKDTAYIKQWKYEVVSPTILHKFCMQFSPLKISKITDGCFGFSPLSTALIIRTKWVTKENLLIGEEGKWI